MNDLTAQSYSDRTDDRDRAAPLPESDRHRLLSAERRRVVLTVLDEERTPIDLEDLATAVARREADADAVDAETVERVAISLHHNHLPRMANLGVVDYDAATRVVE